MGGGEPSRGYGDSSVGKVSVYCKSMVSRHTHEKAGIVLCVWCVLWSQRWKCGDSPIPGAHWSVRGISELQVYWEILSLRINIKCNWEKNLNVSIWPLHACTHAQIHTNNYTSVTCTHSASLYCHSLAVNLGFYTAVSLSNQRTVREK